MNRAVAPGPSRATPHPVLTVTCAPAPRAHRSWTIRRLPLWPAVRRVAVAVWLVVAAAASAFADTLAAFFDAHYRAPL